MVRVNALGAMAIVALPLVAVVIFLIITGEAAPFSFDPGLKTQLVVILPAASVFAGGCIAVAATRGVVLTTALTFLGVATAYMLSPLNDQSILVPQMLTSWGFTLPELQATAIVVFFLVGAVLGAATRS